MNKFRTDILVERVGQMKKELPVLLANQAQREFTNSFKKQGFDGDQWQEVKRRQPGTPEYKYPLKKQLSRRTSPILVRTGKLRRAVSESIRNATFESIKLVVDLPYAQYQNDGTGKIPKRQYMGDNPSLREKQRELILKGIDKVFKK